MKDKYEKRLEHIDLTPISKLQGIIDASDDLNYLYRVKGLVAVRRDLTQTQIDYWDIQISRKINRLAFDSRTAKYLDDPLGR